MRRQRCGDRHPAPTSGLCLSRPHCSRFSRHSGEQVTPGSTPKDTVRTTVTWPSFYSYAFLVLIGLKNWLPAEKMFHLPVCELKVCGCPHRQSEERTGLPNLEVEAKFRSGPWGKARPGCRAHPEMQPCSISPQTVSSRVSQAYFFFFAETTYLPQHRRHD